MSMPIIERPDNPVDRDQAVSDLIESVALMEAGLSHVINAEGEKIQKVVDPDADYPLEDIVAVNNSAERMINTVSKLEMMLQSKLEATKELDTGTTPEPGEGYGAILASSVRGTMTSADDGSPSVALSIFGNDNESITFEGTPDFISSNFVLSWPLPRDGILTDFSVYFNLTSSGVGSDVERRLVARLYWAEPDSIIYYPINGTTINFSTIPAGVVDDFYTSGSLNNLNIELRANYKYIMVVYMITDSTFSSVIGVAGGSLNII